VTIFYFFQNLDLTFFANGSEYFSDDKFYEICIILDRFIVEERSSFFVFKLVLEIDVVLEDRCEILV
jgi:hypothetical protein